MKDGINWFKLWEKFMTILAFTFLEEAVLVIVVIASLVFRWFTLFYDILVTPKFKIIVNNEVVDYAEQGFTFICHKWISANKPVSEMPDITKGNWWVDFKCLDQPIIDKQSDLFIDEMKLQEKHKVILNSKTKKDETGADIKVNNIIVEESQNHIYEITFQDAKYALSGCKGPKPGFIYIESDGEIYSREVKNIELGNIDSAMILSDFYELPRATESNSYWVLYEDSIIHQFAVRFNLALVTLITFLVLSIAKDESSIEFKFGLITSVAGLVCMIPGFFKLWRSKILVNISIVHMLKQIFTTYRDTINDLKNRKVVIPKSQITQLTIIPCMYLGLPGVIRVLLHFIFSLHFIVLFIKCIYISIKQKKINFYQMYWMTDPLLLMRNDKRFN